MLDVKRATQLISVLSLFTISCALEPEEQSSETNNQQQGIVASNNSTSSSEPPATEMSFPENITDNTDLYYGMAKNDIDYEGQPQPPESSCDLIAPPDWDTKIVLGKVESWQRFIPSECDQETDIRLASRHEATIKVHKTLHGNDLPSKLNIHYRVDPLTPNFREGENVIVSFIEEKGHYLAYTTVFVENNLDDFENRPFRILSTPQNEVVNLPQTYGQLDSILKSTKSNFSTMCNDHWGEHATRQWWLDYFFLSDEEGCFSGGPVEDDNNNQPGPNNETEDDNNGD